MKSTESFRLLLIAFLMTAFLIAACGDDDDSCAC